MAEKTQTHLEAHNTNPFNVCLEEECMFLHVGTYKRGVDGEKRFFSPKVVFFSSSSGVGLVDIANQQMCHPGTMTVHIFHI